MPNIALKASFTLYILILSAALLFPFNFSNPISHVKTNVTWLSDTNGIDILSTSAIPSIEPPKRLCRDLLSGDGITVDIWINTKNETQGGPARIVSYSYNKYLCNFTLGQSGRNMVLRLRTTKTDLCGQPDLKIRDVFVSDMLQHIVISYDYSQVVVYINGVKRLMPDIYTGEFSNWDPSYLLILGNEVTGTRPWLGKIHKVAIYNRALSHQEVIQNYEAGMVFPSNKASQNRYVLSGLEALYLFDEGSGDIVTDKSGLRPAIDLNIPQELKVTNKVFLRSPYQNYTLDTHTLKDLVVNILGFIPFGFVLHIMIRSRCHTTLKAIAIVFIFGLLYTFSIEILQYFLESRVSSMTDIANNNIGIVLGIIVNKICLKNANMSDHLPKRRLSI